MEKKTAKKKRTTPDPQTEVDQYKLGRAHAVLLWACLGVLALVPLVFSTSVYRIFVFPKFATLLFGSAVILLALSLAGQSRNASDLLRPVKSVHAWLVALLFIPITLSTLFGVQPVATFWGSYGIQMGLLSRLCFLVLFIGLVTAIGYSRRHFELVLWTMAATGLIVSLYAFAQLVGRDPFLSARLYTFNAEGGPITRVVGTLGHSNYLGNFLLYTTPLTAGLALAKQGRARRIAVVAVGLSIAAIVFCGARGAWIGLAAAALVLAFLGAERAGASEFTWTLRSAIKTGTGAIAVIMVIGVLLFSPASRSVSVRAREFVRDRFTGSGRTLLWRDALKMVSDFSLIGCGPEGFSKAFPAYKSMELARYAPIISDESSHNCYLDAAISYGAGGALLYAAIITSAILLLLKTRRAAADRGARMCVAGLIAAAAGVATHNLFIYDQIPTGLYFFALVALALAARNVCAVRGQSVTRETSNSRRAAWMWRLGALGAAGAVVATAWYYMAEARSEAAIKRTFAAAKAYDVIEILSSGRQAAESPDPTHPYHFLFARALAAYLSGGREDLGEQRRTQQGLEIEIPSDVEEVAKIGVEYGAIAAERSLNPVADNVLLGYLAMLAGDTDALRRYAGRAVQSDPTYYGGHWLMAESKLADGDRAEAAGESRLAFAVNPASRSARSTLARAERSPEQMQLLVSQLIRRADTHAEHGRIIKAINVLHRAIRVSVGPCPSCHRSLALIYEKQGRLAKAISEWHAYSDEAPSEAGREGVERRISDLQNRLR